MTVKEVVRAMDKMNETIKLFGGDIYEVVGDRYIGECANYAEFAKACRREYNGANDFLTAEVETDGFGNFKATWWLWGDIVEAEFSIRAK